MMDQMHEDEGVVLEDEHVQGPPLAYGDKVGDFHTGTEAETSLQKEHTTALPEEEAPQHPATPPHLTDPVTNEDPPNQAADSPPLLLSPPNEPQKPLTRSASLIKNTLPQGHYTIFNAHHLALLSPSTLRTDAELQSLLFKDRVVERERNEKWASIWSWSGSEDYDLDVIDLGCLEGEPVMSGALDAVDGRCEVCTTPTDDGGGGRGAVEAMVEAGVLAL